MRKLLPLLVAILLCTLGFSQNKVEPAKNSSPSKQSKVKKSKQFRIAVNLGESNALGEFSEIDQNSENSGYADEGLSLSFSFQYRVHENFSVSLLYGSTANRFNEQAAESQLRNLEPRLNWRVEGNPYFTRHFMVGAKGFVGDKVKGYINPMFGYGIMIAPQVNVVASDGTNTVSQLFRESEPAGSTVLGISFGVDFFVANFFSINIDGTYLTSEFDIEQFFDTFDANGNFGRITRTYDQPYEVMNFSLGLGLHF